MGVDSLVAIGLGSHIEICVFVDSTEPLLFGYSDSLGAKTARCMVQRKANPRFYVENEYEVTKILKAPTSQPKVISDTSSRRSSYKFVTEDQEKQIRSTILLNIDLQVGCALVVSCTQANAIVESNSELMTFSSRVTNN